jgi:hypothetical protein|tara:strand:- start:660 stop:812 length:153 start_codon:yes stop_codon:yes gene_type:complete
MGAEIPNLLNAFQILFSIRFEMQGGRLKGLRIFNDLSAELNEMRFRPGDF